MMQWARWIWVVALGLGCAAAANAGHPAEVVLERVGVKPPIAVPIWELRRGEDRLIVLSDISPRRNSELVYVDPGVLQEITREAQAYVNAPGVAVDDSVSLWRGMWMLRAYRKAMRNPDNGRLRDILEPAIHQKWVAARARFFRSTRRGETWRPWYAAFKLHEMALKQHGVGKGATVQSALIDAFKQRAEDRVDARYRMKVDASRQDVGEFAIDPELGIACLVQTLERLGPTFDTADEGADAWDHGDLDALRDYFKRVPPLERCWERLINRRTAELQGMPDPYALAEPHWLEVVQELFREKDTVVTYLPARMLVSRTGVIGRLVEQGWALQRRS